MQKLFKVVLGLAMALSVFGTAMAAEPDYRNGTPWPDTDLEGVVTEDMEASIKDNFVLAVNKEKILSTKIPKGYSCGGTVMDLQLKQAENLKNLFSGETPQGHDQRLAYNLYKLMMDWESRNALGVKPLKKATDAIEGIDTMEALNAYFIETPPEDLLAMPWSFEAGPDFMDSSRNVLTVGCAPLLLGDSAEYSSLTEYGIIKKKAISELAQKMLIKLGYTDKEAQQKLENCLSLEKMMAPAIYTNEEQHSADFIARANNRFNYDTLTKVQGKTPVLANLAKRGYPKAREYVVISPDFLSRLDQLYTQENLALFKDYMIVHWAVTMAPSLDRECYEWDTACSNALTGASGMLPDEEKFSSDVASLLEWPVARLYADKYLKQEDKERISRMVDRIFRAYHGVINEADFLSGETKAKAIEKLEAIDKRVLFPDSWDKYACDELNFASPAEGGTLWQALRNIKAYNIAKKVSEYKEPVDKSKWYAAPHTVNCFYDPTSNAIHILGGYAQGELYRSDMNEEELLGTLGSVIGHEISHAFDSIGAQFDKDGNVKNWWTKADYDAFRARNDKMIAYYNNMHPWAGQNFHGSIMTGEACADMAGVKAVLRIAAENKDFDYDKFFRAFANIWVEKNTLQSAYIFINDPHPLNYLRVNCTLQQFDEFLNFYGIREGDGMYLAPEDRVAIW